jgi:hypothetical protein
VTEPSLLLGEPEPERTARGMLRDFIEEVFATGEPTDSHVLTLRAQAALTSDPDFWPMAARQYIAEWVPRLVRDEAHRTRTPGTIRPSLSEAKYREAVLRKWEIIRITVGEGKTKVVDDIFRPELAADADRRSQQIDDASRFVAFERYLIGRLPDDTTRVGEVIAESERFEIWDNYFGRRSEE